MSSVRSTTAATCPRSTPPPARWTRAGRRSGRAGQHLHLLRQPVRPGRAGDPRLHQRRRGAARRRRRRRRSCASKVHALGQPHGVHLRPRPRRRAPRPDGTPAAADRQQLGTRRRRHGRRGPGGDPDHRRAGPGPARSRPRRRPASASSRSGTRRRRPRRRPPASTSPTTPWATSSGRSTAACPRTRGRRRGRGHDVPGLPRQLVGQPARDVHRHRADGTVLRQRDGSTRPVRQRRADPASWSASATAQEAVTELEFDDWGSYDRIVYPENADGERYTVDYVFDADRHTDVGLRRRQPRPDTARGHRSTRPGWSVAHRRQRQPPPATPTTASAGWPRVRAPGRAGDRRAHRRLHVLPDRARLRLRDRAAPRPVRRAAAGARAGVRSPRRTPSTR